MFSQARLHRTTFQPSSKYCLHLRLHLMTRLPVTQVDSTVLPVSSFDQTPLDSRFCPLESTREYWTCVVFLGENQLARKCNEPNRIKFCSKTQRIQLVRSVLHFVGGGVRHEIRPIRMRYLQRDFRAKFSLNSKLVQVISTLYLRGKLLGHFISILVTLVLNILIS